MILLPIGVVWVGYLLTWWGYSMVRGPGIGIADLANPSHREKVDGVIRTWGGIANASDPSGKIGGGFSAPSPGTSAPKGGGKIGAS